MMSLMQPMKNMGTVNERLQRGVSAAAEIFGMLDQDVEKEQGGLAIERARGALDFDAVRFRYRPELAEALWRQMIGWFIQYEEEKLRSDIEAAGKSKQ